MAAPLSFGAAHATDSPICRNAGEACPVRPLWVIGDMLSRDLFLIHKIPICLHTVLIICRSPFLAQQFHIVDLFLKHIHEIHSVI